MEVIEIKGVKARVAKTFFERARGLMGTKDLGDDEGMLILKCNAIHTFFMAMTIDATFLDKNDNIVKVVKNIRPWRMLVWGGFKAFKVLETKSKIA
jgi:uncharacterized membrane protein (UPF0127 family)